MSRSSSARDTSLSLFPQDTEDPPSDDDDESEDNEDEDDIDPTIAMLKKRGKRKKKVGRQSQWDDKKARIRFLKETFEGA